MRVGGEGGRGCEGEDGGRVGGGKRGHHYLHLYVCEIKLSPRNEM